MKLSIEYANHRTYLDDLFQVYPTIPDGIREINKEVWKSVEKAFKKKNNALLIRELLKLELFPVKDNSVSFLKRNISAIEHNPRTVNSICGRLYEMGIDKMFEQCTVPKETIRQVGPMFRNWLKNKPLGIAPVNLKTFLQDNNDAILDGNDKVLTYFACEELNYKHNKGLDFVGRFNKKYVIGTTKFLTDFRGHQNAQFEDAINILDTKDVKAEKVAILDGVLYIKGNNKMYKSITETYKNYNIMSALVLRDFLYQL